MHKSEKLKNTAIAILVVIAAGVGLFLWNQDKKDNLEQIANPAVGDLYQYEQENGMYSDYKVFAVDGDNVSVWENEYEIDTKSAMDELGTDYFDEPGEEIIFTKTDLQAMYDEKIIFNVVR